MSLGRTTVEPSDVLARRDRRSSLLTGQPHEHDHDPFRDMAPCRGPSRPVTYTRDPSVPLEPEDGARSRRRWAGQGCGTSLGKEAGIVLRASQLDRLFVESLGHLGVREPVRELPKKLGAIQFRHRNGIGPHLSLSYENHVANEKNQLLRVELTRSLCGHRFTNRSGRRCALNRCTERTLLRCRR